MAWIRFKKREIPGGLWSKCPECETMLYQKDLEESKKVCKECGYHFRIGVRDRIEIILDEGSFEEVDAGMRTIDALDFIDNKAPYPEKLEKSREKTGRNDGALS